VDFGSELDSEIARLEKFLNLTARPLE